MTDVGKGKVNIRNSPLSNSHQGNKKTTFICTCISDLLFGGFVLFLASQKYLNEDTSEASLSQY